MEPATSDAGPYESVTLTGSIVRLEPLSRAHVEGLVAASSEDRRTYTFTRVPAGMSQTTGYVEELLSEQREGLSVPFVQVRVADGRVVGATRLMTLRTSSPAVTPFAVEIGGTWIAASAQRSGVNTEAKLLLMDFAFDSWGVVRVDLRTDVRNKRSRAAIERLGATLEGVLRQWQPSLVVGEEGAFRDSAIFSIVRDEWPERRRRIVALLSRAVST